MTQRLAAGATWPPVVTITRWDRCRHHIAEMEIELGLRDEWPDDVPRWMPPVPDPRITTEFRR